VDGFVNKSLAAGDSRAGVAAAAVALAAAVTGRAPAAAAAQEVL
jgi:hypothetical protein